MLQTVAGRTTERSGPTDYLLTFAAGLAAGLALAELHRRSRGSALLPSDRSFYVRNDGFVWVTDHEALRKTIAAAIRDAGLGPSFSPGV